MRSWRIASRSENRWKHTRNHPRPTRGRRLSFHPRKGRASSATFGPLMAPSRRAGARRPPTTSTTCRNRSGPSSSRSLPTSAFRRTTSSPPEDSWACFRPLSRKGTVSGRLLRCFRAFRGRRYDFVYPHEHRFFPQLLRADVIVKRLDADRRHDVLIRPHADERITRRAGGIDARPDLTARAVNRLPAFLWKIGVFAFDHFTAELI